MRYQSQDDKEKKRLELLERKKENQRLLDEETSKIKGKSPKEGESGGKVTRAQIDEVLQTERQQQEQMELKPKGEMQINRIKSHQPCPDKILSIH